MLALAYRVSSPAERTRVFGVGRDAVAQLKAEARRPRPELAAFRAALRARSPHAIVTTVIAALNAIGFAGLLLGSGAMASDATLLGWGASVGPRTTDGEWWRLLTSLFLHDGLFYLLVSVALIVQLGAILERIVGRLTFALVYVLAGICAGLVHLSSHPVEVT